MNGNLVVRYGTSIDRERWELMKPPIGFIVVDWPAPCNLVDKCNAFYADAAKIQHEHCEALNGLPKGFYGKEFLDVDPKSIDSMLEFQRAYGLVAGPRAVPVADYTDDERMPIPDKYLFRSEHFRALKEGIRASMNIYDNFSRYIYENLRYGREPYIPCFGRDGKQLSSDDFPYDPIFVSSVEASETIKLAQDAIRGLSSTQSEEKRFTSDDCEVDEIYLPFVNAVLSDTVSVIERIDDSNSFLPRRCGVIQLVMLQLCKALYQSGTFRVCRNPECGRLFKPSDMGRRADASYCSEYCQKRAKDIRGYSARRKRAEVMEGE